MKHTLLIKDWLYSFLFLPTLLRRLRQIVGERGGVYLYPVQFEFTTYKLPSSRR